jgi:hypothetical protein
MQVTNSDIKSAEIQAVVIRADGTTQDLGTIAYYHVNPLKRFAFWLKKKIKRG